MVPVIQMCGDTVAFCLGLITANDWRLVVHAVQCCDKTIEAVEGEYKIVNFIETMGGHLYSGIVAKQASQ